MFKKECFVWDFRVATIESLFALFIGYIPANDFSSVFCDSHLFYENKWLWAQVTGYGAEKPQGLFSMGSGLILYLHGLV